MARESKFLKLYLPGRSDNYDVERDQNDNFLKLDAAAEQAQKMATDLFSDKYDKTGGPIRGNGDVISIYSTKDNAGFISFWSDENRKGYIGRGSSHKNHFVLGNDVTRKELVLNEDGKAYYGGYEILDRRNADPNLKQDRTDNDLKTKSKVVAEAINELKDSKFDITGGVITGGGGMVKLDTTVKNSSYISFMNTGDVVGNVGKLSSASNAVALENKITSKVLELNEDGKAYYDSKKILVDENLNNAIGNVKRKFPLNLAREGDICYVPSLDSYYVCVKNYSGATLQAPNGNFEKITVWGNLDKINNIYDGNLIRLSKTRGMKLYKKKTKVGNFIDVSKDFSAVDHVQITPWGSVDNEGTFAMVYQNFVDGKVLYFSRQFSVSGGWQNSRHNYSETPVWGGEFGSCMILVFGTLK